MGAIAAFSVSDGAAVRRLGLAQVCPIHCLSRGRRRKGFKVS
jgi:hypothetical protein